jgi:hypothetical protein
MQSIDFIMSHAFTLFANAPRVPAHARAWMLGAIDRGRGGAGIGSTLDSIQQ